MGVVWVRWVYVEVLDEVCGIVEGDDCILSLDEGEQGLPNWKRVKPSKKSFEMW